MITCPKLTEDGECPFGINLPAACVDCKGDIQYKLDQQEKKEWLRNPGWTDGWKGR